LEIAGVGKKTVEYCRKRKVGGKPMVRKTRSDCTVGSFEKTRGLPQGSIRNPDGRDTRSDKKIGTIREENQKNKDK
jgi:hypothetical protein